MGKIKGVVASGALFLLGRERLSPKRGLGGGIEGRCKVMKTGPALEYEGDSTNWGQLGLRIFPMLMVAWVRPFSLILPGMIATYDLSLDEAGFSVTVLEVGGVAAMVMLGWMLDRWGAIRMVGLALAMASVALIVSAFAPIYEILLLAFVFIGIGTAATACSVNALMAEGGDRRIFYLGLAHTLFGFSSIAAPLVAGIIVATSGWQRYYLVLGNVGLLISVAVYVATAGARRNWRPIETSSISRGARGVIRDIGPICLGIAAVVGVQGIFNSWSYLDVVARYGIEHSSALLAPACVWTGILVGRAIHTWLADRIHPRQLLIASCVVAVSGAHCVAIAWSFIWAGCALVMVGVGVSGAYQLGTAWAVELAPRRIGAASTFVMASAAMGSGVCTWITGIAVEGRGFGALPWVVSVVLLVGMISFLFKRHNRLRWEG